MSYTTENWRKAIAKLLELTSKGKIHWEPSELYKGDSWLIVDSSFQAKMNDKTYVVSKTRGRHFLDETEFVWTGGFNLSIFEEHGFQGHVQIAIAPEISSAGALFDAAEANMAFNRNALGDLLD